MDLNQNNLVQLACPEYLTCFAESRIGGRSENQDSFGSQDTPLGFLVTVCDGMGGGPGGKTASSIAVKEIIAGVMEGNQDDIPQNVLIKAIRRANMSMIEYTHQHPEFAGMGSTCTVLLINEHSAIVAYVGDSRVYQLRGKQKIYRTFDHSMVFDLVKQKVITEEQARLAAQSNVITRALGVKYDVEVDCIELSYQRGDRFLLSTDGIHGSLPENKLIELAANRVQSLGAITDEIATIIDGDGRNNGGGHDNLTLAIIETSINSKLKSKMKMRTKCLMLGLTAVCLISLGVNLYLFSRPSYGSKEADRVIDSLENRLDSVNSLCRKLSEKAVKDSIKIQTLNNKVTEQKKHSN